jgi:hypothetical protein
MQETIYQALSRLMAEGLAPEVAAAKSLDNMTKAQLVEFVRPEVERLARNIERNRVRRIERRVLPVTDGETSADSVGELVAQRFVLPDGRMVTWGDATAEDHELRAGWQRQRAREFLADVSRHEWAAELIRSSNVTCLNDLGISSPGDLVVPT